jgi:hypothetical protein
MDHDADPAETTYDCDRLGQASCASEADATVAEDVTLFEQREWAARFQRHSRQLLAICIMDCGKQNAMDVLQDAWLRAWRFRNQCDCERDDGGPWLMTITRNTCRDFHRLRKRRKEISGIDDLEGLATSRTTDSRESAETLSAVRGRIDRARLTGDEWKACTFELDFAILNDRWPTYGETAAALGWPLPPATKVGVMRSRYRAKLRQMYADYGIPSVERK